MTRTTDISTTASDITQPFTTTTEQSRPIIKTDSHPTPFTYHPPSPSTSIQTTQLPQSERTITDASPSADPAAGGKPHGNGMAVIAGVSATVVVLVLLAAVIITCTVVMVYVVKKHAPQSRGFTRLSVTSTEKNAVAI